MISLHGVVRIWQLAQFFAELYSTIDSRRGWEYIRPFWGFWGMSRTTRRVGVVLFQLGGPDTLEAIEPFLYNLFCDPDIIDFPFARIGRKPLAKLISTTRARKVQHHYATIGGGSPIRRNTERQARALELELNRQGVERALFRGHALLASVHQRGDRQLRQAECDEVVLLPLYPQYSSTTTGSSLNEWRRLFRGSVPTHCVESFYRNTMYLDAVVEKVKEALRRFPAPGRPEIVFSAHSVPMSVIEKGDPYQRQIEETVQLLMERGGWSNLTVSATKAKWEPADGYSLPCIKHCMPLAAEQVREMCVVPVAFVSDHVETLGEIDHEARAQARRLGFTQFEMSAGLNDSPKFIFALAQIVVRGHERNGAST